MEEALVVEPVDGQVIKILLAFLILLIDVLEISDNIHASDELFVCLVECFYIVILKIEGLSLCF